VGGVACVGLCVGLCVGVGEWGCMGLCVCVCVVCVCGGVPVCSYGKFILVLSTFSNFLSKSLKKIDI